MIDNQNHDLVIPYEADRLLWDLLLKFIPIFLLSLVLFLNYNHISISLFKLSPVFVLVIILLFGIIKSSSDWHRQKIENIDQFQLTKRKLLKNCLLLYSLYIGLVLLLHVGIYSGAYLYESVCKNKKYTCMVQTTNIINKISMKIVSKNVLQVKSLKDFNERLIFRDIETYVIFSSK